MKGTTMKHLAIVIAALAVFTSYAWAACPFGTTYSCVQGFNGKVICGCR